MLAQVLRPDANCLDIGCHLGSMLSEIVRLAPRGNHIAFEAIPEKVSFLRRKFPGVRIHDTALSDEEGTSSFFINEKRTGFSGLARHGEGVFRETVVRCRRLDLLTDYAYDVFLPRDFLVGAGPIERARFEKALVHPFQAFNWIAEPRARPAAPDAA